jgi:histidinol-phosphate/aromatic aminotransferase/cobyric acid decarboxylase-like protein
VSAQLRARRDEERASAVTELPVLDLSSSAWPGPPHPDAVNAATFALRRALNAYPDPAPLREAIAAAHGVEPAQVALGHGAGELLRNALATVAAGGEVAVAWPGWGPLPRLVHEAGGTPVPVPLDPAGAADPAALLAATGDATRAVVLCTPNDPTGAATDPTALLRLAERLPERVWLLVDAALAGFEPDGPPDGGAAASPLLAARERVLVVHSASKVHALAGLRAGYALGPAGTLLDRLAPVLGIAAPAQAALAWAVESGGESAARRRALAATERDRLAAALEDTPLSFPAGHGPLVWLGSSEHDGRTIASHLASSRITAMPGTAWGDAAHVRLTLRDAPATDRLVAALRDLPALSAARGTPRA